MYACTRPTQGHEEEYSEDCRITRVMCIITIIIFHLVSVTSHLVVSHRKESLSTYLPALAPSHLEEYACLRPANRNCSNCCHGHTGDGVEMSEDFAVSCWRDFINCFKMAYCQERRMENRDLHICRTYRLGVTLFSPSNMLLSAQDASPRWSIAITTTVLPNNILGFPSPVPTPVSGGRCSSRCRWAFHHRCSSRCRWASSRSLCSAAAHYPSCTLASIEQ